MPKDAKYLLPTLNDPAAIEALVLQWRHLPKHVYARLCGLPDVRALGFEEGEAAGMRGLFRAAQLFQDGRLSRHTGRPVKFITVAYSWVRQHIREAARRHWRHLTREKPFSRFEAPDGDPVEDFFDRAPESHLQPVEEDPRWPAVRRALDELGGREREVLEARLWGGEKLKAIGERLGISKERVRQLQDRALRLLRQRFGVGD